MIHPLIERAFQEIDAACFSGDDLEYSEFRERLAYFLIRWRKQLDDTSPDRSWIEELAEQYESGELQV